MGKSSTPAAVSLSPSELMAAADRLSGVHPGMNHEQIRAALISMTPERMMTRYLIEKFKQTRDSGERGELRDRMEALVAENGHLRRLINQGLADRVSIVSKRGPGRPRKYASDKLAKREADRAYRARKKGAATVAEG